MANVPALDSSPSSSSASSLLDVPTTDRPNEHLAVLLPRHLWKLDSSSSFCDNFYCHVSFSLFERKHHCRKCGGVFCGACTSRTTLLLDSSKLPFLQPPRNVPLTVFESPTSPILDSRVCDDCWDQIHGCPTTPHTPDVQRPSFKRAISHPISMFRFPLSPTMTSSMFSISGSSTSPTDAVLPPSLSSNANHLQNSPSETSLSSTTGVPVRSPRRINVRTTQLALPQDLERSYGELDAYPLRRSSVLCKATGGGRWEPKQIPVLDGYRQPIPGGKAPFEIEMEREEKLERLRKLNPIIKDGAFQYRFPPKPCEPEVLCRSFRNTSTF